MDKNLPSKVGEVGVADIPLLVHRLSYWLVRVVTGTPLGRGAVEAMLRSYYTRARHRGLANLAIPLWYRWLRAYYFMTLRKHLSNADFQRKYWELGSLTAYRRYVVADAEDVRVLRFIEEIVERVRIMGACAGGRRLRVLEVGCGGGMSLRALLDALGDHVPMVLYSVDISMHGLLLARDVVDDQASLVQASVIQLPFRGRFDLGFCRGVLMFLEEKEVAKAFSELARLCRMFVLTEPAGIGGEQVDVSSLDASLEREDIDQTSWIHPYPRLAVSTGGKVVAEEYVSSNYLMVIEWQDNTRGDGDVVP